VQPRGDVVDGAAMLGGAISNGAGMGVEPLIGGEQRGMDVDHPAGPAIDEVLAQDAHEAGEADDVHFPAFEHHGHGVFEHLAGNELALGQGGRGQALGGGNFQTGCGSAIGQYTNDFSGIVCRLRSSDERGHVRSAPGDEYADPLAAHSLSAPRKVTASPVRSVRAPTMAAVSPEALRLSTSFSASAGLTATSMPTPQLKVRSISRSSMPPTLESQPKTAGTLTAARSMSAAR